MDLIDLLGEQRQEPGIQDAPFSALVESYQRYYAAGSSHTARAKRLDLRHFSDFLARYRGLSKPEKLRVRDWDHSSVQRFVDDRLQIGEAPATVARRLATLKHMGRTLSEKLPGFVNPAREVKPPKIRPPRPKGLSEPDLAAARERADARMDGKRSFIRIRNYTLFEFLLDTGIRADEARLLKRGQLDEKMEWVQNVRTKGKRYRNVYITSRVRPLMQQYLEARAYELKRFFARISKSKDAALPLFLSTYAADPAKPESFLMGAKTIWRAVHEFSHERQLHPHLLRHSFAIDLLEHSNDVRLVAQALGHSDVRVTMRYTERTDEEVKRALEASREASRQ